MIPLPENPVWETIFNTAWQKTELGSHNHAKVQECPNLNWYYSLMIPERKQAIMRLERHPTTNCIFENSLIEELVITDNTDGISNLIIIRFRAPANGNYRKHVAYIAFASDETFAAKIIMFSDILFG